MWRNSSTKKNDNTNSATTPTTTATSTPYGSGTSTPISNQSQPGAMATATGGGSAMKKEDKELAIERKSSLTFLILVLCCVFHSSRMFFPETTNTNTTKRTPSPNCTPSPKTFEQSLALTQDGFLTLSHTIEELLHQLEGSNEIEEDLSIIYWKIKRSELLMDDSMKHAWLSHASTEQRQTWNQLLKVHASLLSELKSEVLEKERALTNKINEQRHFRKLQSATFDELHEEALKGGHNPFVYQDYEDDGSTPNYRRSLKKRKEGEHVDRANYLDGAFAAGSSSRPSKSTNPFVYDFDDEQLPAARPGQQVFQVNRKDEPTNHISPYQSGAVAMPIDPFAQGLRDANVSISSPQPPKQTIKNPPATSPGVQLSLPPNLHLQSAVSSGSSTGSDASNRAILSPPARDRPVAVSRFPQPLPPEQQITPKIEKRSVAATNRTVNYSHQGERTNYTPSSTKTNPGGGEDEKETKWDEFKMRLKYYRWLFCFSGIVIFFIIFIILWTQPHHSIFGSASTETNQADSLLGSGNHNASSSSSSSSSSSTGIFVSSTSSFLSSSSSSSSTGSGTTVIPPDCLVETIFLQHGSSVDIWYSFGTTVTSLPVYQLANISSLQLHVNLASNGTHPPPTITYQLNSLPVLPLPHDPLSPANASDYATAPFVLASGLTVGTNHLTIDAGCTIKFDMSILVQNGTSVITSSSSSSSSSTGAGGSSTTIGSSGTKPSSSSSSSSSTAQISSSSSSSSTASISSSSSSSSSTGAISPSSSSSSTTPPSSSSSSSSAPSSSSSPSSSTSSPISSSSSSSTGAIDSSSALTPSSTIDSTASPDSSSTTISSSSIDSTASSSTVDSSSGTVDSSTAIIDSSSSDGTITNTTDSSSTGI